MEEFPASKVQNQTYWEVFQQTYVQTLLAGWVWTNSNIQPFSEGEGLGRKEKKVSDKYHIPAILNIQSP